jgi:hypothetical protein
MAQYMEMQGLEGFINSLAISFNGGSRAHIWLANPIWLKLTDLHPSPKLAIALGQYFFIDV